LTYNKKYTKCLKLSEHIVFTILNNKLKYYNKFNQ
jgi:hypothetical protein